MPLAALLRILGRLLVIGALGAMRRRAMRGTAPPPPWRTPGSQGPADPAAELRREVGRRLAEPMEIARLTLRVVEVTILAVAVAVLLSAGTASAVVAVRWVGAVLLGLAAVLGAITVREARAARRLVLARRRRRHAERLASAAYER